MNIKEFEERTGMEQMRVIVAALNGCRESFLDQFTIPQLIKLYKAWLNSKWDFMPDEWTDRQVKNALRGKAPMWDNNENPIYTKPPATRRLDK